MSDLTTLDAMDQVDNPFYSPWSGVMIKGKEEDGKWMVYLEASNMIEDDDSEVVDVKALKKARDYYLSRGVISWDHKHKVTHDPKYIIGEPLDVQFSGDERTLVKGFLYKQNKVAQSVWDNVMSEASRLGASIGGGVLHKARNRIVEVVWDETAITHKPVNVSTLGHVRLVPFTEFVKALMAGSGVDAASFTGGRALTQENLQGAVVDKFRRVDREELTDLFTDVVHRVMDKSIGSYNDLVDFVLSKGYSEGVANRIIRHIAQNMSRR